MKATLFHNKIWRRIINLCYRFTFLNLVLFIDYWVSRWFYHQDTFESFSGSTTKNNPYLCIFSHFDINNIVDPYVIFYLQELARMDCDIIFVTTCPTLSLIERNKIAPYCKKIIIRQNRGRDFGAFKCGINNIDNLAEYQKIILANDSVYGPLQDLTEALNYGDNHQLDIWGTSDSLAGGYHIQSYFVIFGKKILTHPAFLQFWASVYYLGNRQNIINRYEIGMSKYFLNRGFKLGAVCRYADLQKAALTLPALQNKLDKKTRTRLKKQLNPTYFFWNVLISEYKFPFIKRDLLFHNLKNLDISDWKELVKKHSQFDVDLIQKHLSRLES